MKQIAVIGSGSWGTALSIIAARAGHRIQMWARSREIAESINRMRANCKYLSAVQIPEGVTATSDLQRALEGCEIVILAVPSHAVRELLKQMSAVLQPRMLVVSATKGIEIETGKRVSEVVEEQLGQQFSERFVCISGPSFAKEVVDDHPTAVVASSRDPESSSLVQSELSFENLRFYTNNDLIGTELGGSVKNVMAIATGIVAGLGFGSNSVAALITRGLAEMVRLSTRAGGRLETMMGLAGLGDLVLTCTGRLSRNRFVGQELGRGRPLDEILAGMTEVAEGVKTTAAVRMLAARLEVEMPITEEVYRVLYDNKSPATAATELMNRPLRVEM